MKVAVIGAGCGGLCAAKNSIEVGWDVVIFEQTDQIGGTWVYREETTLDQFGLSVHSSMYQGLTTKLPKEIMGYPDFPIIEGEKSFISSNEVQKFHHRYADHFNLKSYIKFHHLVTFVTPYGESQWEVVVKDLLNNKKTTLIFDLIFVCNGHYSSSFIPKYPGQEIFRGRQIHSHSYRSKDIFRGERILVVGAGASAVDLISHASGVAAFVAQSHHLQESLNFSSKKRLIQSYPDIVHLTKDGAVFSDGSQDTFTMIVYCTGYLYSFPFLSPDCGISIENNYVSPLYKHCININHPTMAFIGLCKFVMASQLMDLQVRFALKFFIGAKKFPSREEMLYSEKCEIRKRLCSGLRLRKIHAMGPYLDNYQQDLANLAEIKPIKPVLLRLFKEVIEILKADKVHLRKCNFKIIDDETYVKL